MIMHHVLTCHYALPIDQADANHSHTVIVHMAKQAIKEVSAVMSPSFSPRICHLFLALFWHCFGIVLPSFCRRFVVVSSFRHFVVVLLLIRHLFPVLLSFMPSFHCCCQAFVILLALVATATVRCRHQVWRTLLTATWHKCHEIEFRKQKKWCANKEHCFEKCYWTSYFVKFDL